MPTSCHIFEALRSRLLLLLAAAAAAGCCTSAAQAQTLLSYWDFNNDSQTYNSTTQLEGQLATSASGNGEVFSSTTSGGTTVGTLTSNNLGLYQSTSSLQFAGQPAGNTVNGVIVEGSNNGIQSNTGNPGYGLFADSSTSIAGTNGGTNLAAGDSTPAQQGSLLFLINPTAPIQSFTLTLNSSGYRNLVLSFSNRVSSGQTANVAESISYSTDGGATFSSPFATFSGGSGYFEMESFSLDALLGSTLDNLSSPFELKITTTYTGATASSTAFDNIQLTGTAVPEPNAAQLLLCGLGIVAVALPLRHKLRKQKPLAA